MIDLAAIAGRLALPVIAVGLAWVVGFSMGDSSRHRKQQAEIAEALAESVRASEAERQKERQRYEAVQKELNDALQREAQARADADAAADVGRRLRDQIAAARRGCQASSNPGTPKGGPSTDTAGDLLADVQRRLDEATDTIARFADTAHSRGLACERASDSVRSAN